MALIPGHRRDLAIEADIIEEVAAFAATRRSRAACRIRACRPFRPDPQRLTDQLRASLSGAGLTELITHGLIGPEDHARLGFGADDPGTIVAANPVTIDHSSFGAR